MNEEKEKEIRLCRGRGELIVLKRRESSVEVEKMIVSGEKWVCRMRQFYLER